MPRTMLASLVGIVAIAMVVPGDASAQDSEDVWPSAVIVPRGDYEIERDRGRDRDRSRDRTRKREGDRWHDDRRRGRRGRVGRRAARKGPPFCRNGQGHPVHGWRWCVRKGFARGGIFWERAGWEDVIFRIPIPGRSGRHGRVDQRSLIDILGEVVFGRLAGHGRSVERNAPITGYWTDTSDRREAAVLRLEAGDRPLAELRDLDGDGRVDAVFLNRSR